MASQEKRGKVNVGSSSLIVIFIVLCLVTFGVLSLGNAKSDALLSERNAASVKEFYRADSLGTEFMQKIDLAMKSTDETDAKELKKTILKEYGTFYNEEKDLFITDISMKADQALHIELRPDWKEKSVEAAAWYVYNQEDYEIDRSIKVWDGVS